jgi:hypothetical protein
MNNSTDSPFQKSVALNHWYGKFTGGLRQDLPCLLTPMMDCGHLSLSQSKTNAHDHDFNAAPTDQNKVTPCAGPCHCGASAFAHE